MQYEVDLHIHTVASGHAYSTVLEIVRAAGDRGLKMIALTDHGPRMPGGPHVYHFGNLKAIPPEINGVRVLKGVEANVIDRRGRLDLDEERLSHLDVVLAGLHTLCAPYGSVAENTAMMINAMRNRWVDIIVHPGNPEYPVDEAAIAQAAVEYDVALEVNNSSLSSSRQGSRPHCGNIIRLAKQYGAKLILGSDSHFATTVGDFRQAIALLNENEVGPAEVLNASVERVWQHLMRRRPGRT